MIVIRAAAHLAGSMAQLRYLARMGVQGKGKFGEALQSALTRARWTQQKLAKELQVDPSQVSRWVNNKSIPHVATVHGIERLLSADLSQAFEANVPQHELYVSAPITGLAGEELQSHHDVVADVVDAVRGHANGVYWPGEAIHTVEDLVAPDIATERNMHAFAQCEAFLYVQMAEVVAPSSALIELGLALGKRVKTTLILSAHVRPAYMLDGFSAVAERVHFLPHARIYTVRSSEEAVRLVTKNGRELLGLA